MATGKGSKFSLFAQKLAGVTLGTLLLSMPNTILAASLQDLRHQKSATQEEIRSLQEVAEEQKAVVNSLQAAVALLDRSIAQLAAQISQTESQIAETTAALAQKEEELRQKKSEQNESIRVLYELESGDNMIEAILGNANLSETNNRAEYLDALQEKIARVMEEIARLKAELEAKKVKLESMRVQQLEQRKQLEAQQAQKARLLQNESAELNKLARQLAAQKIRIANIEAAIAAEVAALYRARQGGQGGTGRFVATGTVIGYEGSTGYSTGPHVHFEAIKNGTAVNPRGFIPPLSWPLSSFYVSQEFGRPSWNAAYSWHTGIDLVAPYGAPVMAGCSGEIILDKWYGGYGNAVIIDCDNGLWTLYGHMIN